MTKYFDTERDLVKAIHDLPDAISPKRDLWPGIASRMTGARAPGGLPVRFPAWRHQALAASVAIAFVAGLMFGRQMGSGDLAPVEAATPDLAMQSAMWASEREYQAAFRQFITVGAARTLLESQAVEYIEDSWSELQQAEAALLAALHEFPDNIYLNRKLLDLRSKQLGFMKQLATLDQFSRRKT